MAKITTQRFSLAEFKRLKISKKASKYHAKKTSLDGFKFDSLAEADMYQILKLDPEVLHIDVHPKLSLTSGVTLKVDFLVWKENGTAEAIEVKGFETEDFKNKRKLFDQFHPLAPLKVFRKTRAGWEAI